MKNYKDKTSSKVQEQKLKLLQKKNRLAAEETKLKLKERKILTRTLIDLGSLIVKSKLDYLPTNTLYGALLYLNDQLSKDESIKSSWTTNGTIALNNENSQKVAVILKIENLSNDIECKDKLMKNNNKNSINNNTSKTPETLNSEIRQLLKSYGLSWNNFRSEWYGYCTDIQSLKSSLENSGCKYNIEVIDNS